jgi:hypothetical protein
MAPTEEVEEVLLLSDLSLSWDLSLLLSDLSLCRIVFGGKATVFS